MKPEHSTYHIWNLTWEETTGPQAAQVYTTVDDEKRLIAEFRQQMYNIPLQNLKVEHSTTTEQTVTLNYSDLVVF